MEWFPKMVSYKFTKTMVREKERCETGAYQHVHTSNFYVECTPNVQAYKNMFEP